MIKPLQSNTAIYFKANQESSKEKQPSLVTNAENINPTKTGQKNINTKEKIQGIFKKSSEVINKVDNLFSPLLAPIKAPIQGAGALVGAGILGKNIKESKGSIPKAIKGSVMDIGSGAIKLIKSIPNIITKSPAKNIKNIISAPIKFYSKYLKAHKSTAALATLTGIAIMGRKQISNSIKMIKEKI